MRQPSGSTLALTGSGTVDDASDASITLTAAYAGAPISSTTGWKINGATPTSVDLATGDAFVALFNSGGVGSGDVVTYDGSGPMPIAAGSATLV